MPSKFKSVLRKRPKDYATLKEAERTARRLKKENRKCCDMCSYYDKNKGETNV